MKQVLLSSLALLLTTIAVFAYETIIIKYPDGELWQKAYYKKVGALFASSAKYDYFCKLLYNL